jgi:hypothetical protein
MKKLFIIFILLVPVLSVTGITTEETFVSGILEEINGKYPTRNNFLRPGSYVDTDCYTEVYLQVKPINQDAIVLIVNLNSYNNRTIDVISLLIGHNISFNYEENRDGFFIKNIFYDSNDDGLLNGLLERDEPRGICKWTYNFKNSNELPNGIEEFGVSETAISSSLEFLFIISAITMVSMYKTKKKRNN